MEVDGQILTIVSPAWFADNRDNTTIILDASKTTADLEIKTVIPGAIRFDLQSFRDTHSPYPNTVLNQGEFQEKARAIGINTTSKIIVYDDKGIYTSPRVWWMFKYFGFDSIAVLDGGLPAYIKSNLPTQLGHSKPNKQGNILAIANEELMVGYEQVRANCSSQESYLIDVRSAGRFAGKNPEPRKGLQSGCIPSSLNIPYQEVLNNGSYKSNEELISLLRNRIESRDQPIFFSCGSGTTACIVLLAYVIAFGELGAVYDGSWTEWAIKNELFT